MYLSNVKITNIRCYRSAELQLAPKITLLVGENNSGKSTVIQSIRCLQEQVLGTESIRFGVQEGRIEVFITDVEADRLPANTKAFAQQHKAQNAKLVYGIGSGGISSVFEVREGLSTAYQAFPNQSPNNLIVSFLSDRKAGGFAESVLRGHADMATGSTQYLNAKIVRSFGSSDLHDLYVEACNDVLGLLVTPRQTDSCVMGGLEINIKKNQHIPISQMGAGVAQALTLIVELLLAENKVFLIEELENDLHPRALRRLFALIERSLQAGNQFVVSTHSNVVVRGLGGILGTRLYHVGRDEDEGRVPTAIVSEVPNDPHHRRRLIEWLGYDLSDYDLYDAWLILEESSAERLMREFFIPWFYPSIVGRVRTIAAIGTGDIGPRFIDLQRLFVYIHKAEGYRDKAWVIADGDQAGREAIERLKSTFKDWPTDHFRNFSKSQFEEYYPEPFAERARSVIPMARGEKKRSAKEQLLNEVVAWLRSDPEQGKKGLLKSAVEVVEFVQHIGRRI